MQGFFFNPPLETNFWGHIFEELYKTKLYAPYVEGKKLKMCLEIGGNVGLCAYYFAQHFDEVISLEPNQEVLDLMNHMLEFNKITNVKTLKQALYIENGQFPLWKNESNKTMSSLNKAIHDGKSEPEKVETITLDKLFADNNIEHCDLLKLDCEGAEYEVLGHESFSLVADKIDCIIGESHAWANRNKNQLKESLQNRGFDFKWLPHDADLFIAQKIK